MFEGRRIDQLGARAVRHHVGEPGVLQEVRGAQNLPIPDRVIRLPRFNVLTVAFVQSQLRNLPPEAICEEIENGLVDNLHCSKIWNVESTDPVVRDLAGQGLQSMQKPLVSYNQCGDYMNFKLFTDGNRYYGYYVDHTRRPHPPGVGGCDRQAGEEQIQFRSHRFDNTTIVDECAARFA